MKTLRIYWLKWRLAGEEKYFDLVVDGNRRVQANARAMNRMAQEDMAAAARRASAIRIKLIELGAL